LKISFHKYVVANERKEFKSDKQHLITRKIIVAYPESSNKNMKRNHRTVIDNYKDKFKKISKGNGGMHQVTIQSNLMLSLDQLNTER
jgi:ABC-type oligopeptide transport system ATPase subunit